VFLARVKKSVTATQKHATYACKKVFVVSPVTPDGNEQGDECVAVDCVGAGPGDIVICGSSPGVAKKIFKIGRAPIRTLIIAIVDSIDYREEKEQKKVTR
jgi:microcompartment protein CcmK/EutM